MGCTRLINKQRNSKHRFTHPSKCLSGIRGGALSRTQNRRSPHGNYRSAAGGFTFVELIVGVAVFVVVSLSVYQVYVSVTEVVRLSRLKVIATALANEQFEIARNMPYSDVGIIAGIPAGKLIANKNLVRDNVTFNIITTVRNIDDPFDGTIGGAPNDTSPADFKLVAFDITCPTCKNFLPVSFTTRVAPRALETASANGALFVNVFDANGQPVPGANVHIENNTLIPAIIIDDVTNNAGVLQLVDAPPGAGAYEVTVTKAGYSTERTYRTGDVLNPNPAKAHATVATGQLTQISFAIDRTSTLDITSTRDTCTPIAAQDFTLTGSKLIGTSPDVFKYSINHITDAAGKKILNTLEWDTYSLNFTDTVYDLAGTIPLVPITVNANTAQDLKLIVALKNPQSLLVTVKDMATQLPISQASVGLTKVGFSRSLITGRGFLQQTDWSGGDGQTDFVDPLRYFSSDGNIDVTAQAGEVRLRNTAGVYMSSGSFISSTFDTGSVSNFHQILWQPLSQALEAGPNSIKFQVATNNNNITWNFKGPDGTAGTYYTIADNNINAVHNNERYFRYKAFLSTADISKSPVLADVQFTFTSLCVPPGQVLFTGLLPADYMLDVTRAGYQPFNDTVTIGANWQQREVTLSP